MKVRTGDWKQKIDEIYSTFYLWTCTERQQTLRSNQEVVDILLRFWFIGSRYVPRTYSKIKVEVKTSKDDDGKTKPLRFDMKKVTREIPNIQKRVVFSFFLEDKLWER